MTLYHLTTREAISSILDRKFVNGDDGLVWFSPILDAFGAQGRNLLEVITSFTEKDLQPFRIKVVSDEYWCEQTCAFVADPDGAEVFYWYAIPAEQINSTVSIRVVPLDEERRLRRSFDLYGWDTEDEADLAISCLD